MITKKQTKLRDRIIKEGLYSVRRLQKIDKIHFLTISKELGIDYSEITKYYASMEDIFHLQQIKNWKATYKVLDKKVKEARTPGEFKKIFDDFLEDFVNDLSSDADLHWEACSFLPKCLEFRDINKKILSEKIKNIIKRGWPGKTANVLQRQTDLFILSFYGFIDHVVHLPVEERKKILKDFRNMLNLHLQDRLFF
tara:strand:- start:50 stop:637 length:588 start_codon:yes stop_codon:yes gene_type:complete